ncbi:MAG: hypothetical protein AAF616_10115 [Bacteroidota bacterium]
MKTLLSIVCALFVMSAFGQRKTTVSTQGNITYQVLEDNPERAYTNFIAPEFGAEVNKTDLSIFLGANARKALVKDFTLEAVGRFDVYSMNAGSATFLVEGGVFLPLMTKEKTKEVPVILSYNPYAGQEYNTDDGKLYNKEETKFIKIPSGRYKNQYGVRGGLHYRSIGAEDDINDIEAGNINLGGIYVGGQMTSQAFVKTKINNDVERFGAGFTRLYFDILILPYSELSRDELSAATNSDGVFGWRVGYQWYLSPHDGDYKFFGNSIFGAELGTRPLSGFMFNFSWAYAFNRS